MAQWYIKRASHNSVYPILKLVFNKFNPKSKKRYSPLRVTRLNIFIGAALQYMCVHSADTKKGKKFDSCVCLVMRESRVKYRRNECFQ